MSLKSDSDLIAKYLEADATTRARQFHALLAALSRVRAAGEAAGAAEHARRAVAPLLDYTSVLSLLKYRVDTDEPVGGRPLRLAVLGGPTTDQLVSLLRAFLWAEEILVEVYQCDYRLFRHEILTDDSGLDRFKPEIVFLAVDSHDVSRAPRLNDSAARVKQLLEEESDGWHQLWELTRTKWNAIVIQNTIAGSDDEAVFGHLSRRVPGSPLAFEAALNDLLLETAPAHVVWHDVRSLVYEIGAHEWFDPRFYLEAKMPCAPECLVRYAHSVMSLVRALRGRSRKVLVLDLDNTLWGGVIGDVGVDGIRIGQGSGEGEAFLAFQQFVRSLYDRGVVLAVCSKNDDALARGPFDVRHDMLIRLEHVSCFVANWNDKAQNLSHISETLQLGLDSFVFVDDNPVERAFVRRALPDVAVPDLPDDPAGYAHAVSLHRYFETTSFTAEDAHRGVFYRENAARRALAANASLSDFLASLEMVARAERVTHVNIQRVTQLINKSNQFNLTTKRYTEAEIETIAGRRDWCTLAISLRDRCGDNGLISVLLFERVAKALRIDTWLMSCRVLQRGVEQFALAKAVAAARRLGCDSLEGTYSPTERNVMVSDHYQRLGFKPIGGNGTVTAWRLLVSDWAPDPSHIAEEDSTA